MAGGSRLSDFTGADRQGPARPAAGYTFDTLFEQMQARPSVAIVSFGIRNRIKPFSSLLIYADQDAANPIPTQMDTLGTYVDLEIFYQYISQEFEKYAEYRQNTAYLFAGEGMDELLAIAPPDSPLAAATKPTKLAEVFTSMKDWMNL